MVLFASPSPTGLFLVRYQNEVIREAAHWSVLTFNEPDVARNLNDNTQVALSIPFGFARVRIYARVQHVGIHGLNFVVRPWHELLKCFLELRGVVHQVTVVADVRKVSSRW